MKRFLFLSLLAAALCARAEVSVYELPPGDGASPDSPAVEIAEGGFVTAFAGQSPYGSDVSAPCLMLVREAWTNAAVVTARAFTNLTYSIAFTNGAETVTNTAVRPYESFPATLVGYWTNETVRAWAETNWVPDRCSATTNAFCILTNYADYSGNSLSQTNGLKIGVLPGDWLFYGFSSDYAPPGFRATVWIEH